MMRLQLGEQVLMTCHKNKETSEFPHLVPEVKKFIIALWLVPVLPQDALAAPSGKQSQNVNRAFQTLTIGMCLKGLVNSQNKVIFFSPPALS